MSDKTRNKIDFEKLTFSKNMFHGKQETIRKCRMDLIPLSKHVMFSSIQ